LMGKSDFRCMTLFPILNRAGCSKATAAARRRYCQMSVGAINRGSTVVTALPRRVTTRSVLEVRWDLAAVFGKLGHDLLMQPDVHRRRVVHIAIVMKFLSQRLARVQAAVHPEEFHQIHDR